MKSRKRNLIYLQSYSKILKQDVFKKFELNKQVPKNEINEREEIVEEGSEMNSPSSSTFSKGSIQAHKRISQVSPNSSDKKLFQSESNCDKSESDSFISSGRDKKKSFFSSQTQNFSEESADQQTLAEIQLEKGLEHTVITGPDNKTNNLKAIKENKTKKTSKEEKLKRFLKEIKKEQAKQTDNKVTKHAKKDQSIRRNNVLSLYYDKLIDKNSISKSKFTSLFKIEATSKQSW